MRFLRPTLRQTLRARRLSMTRREFLRAGVRAGATVAAAAAFPRRYWARSTPRVVIVGGGLAGMTAAYQLWSKYRLPSQVYEARWYLGGRVSTLRGLPGGQYTERGGTFISTHDRYVRHLAKRLQVPLIDTRRIRSDGTNLYRFYGANYLEHEITRGLERVEAVAAAQFQAASYAPRQDHNNARAEFWDNMTVAAWLDQYCPGGLNSPLGQYLRVDFETDYGGAVAEASALQIIEDLGAPSAPEDFDERFRVAGGSDAIITALAACLPPGSIHLGTPLTGLTRNGDGTVRCVLGSGASAAAVDADFLILSLPFSVLRSVEYSSLAFDPLKTMAIRNLGMGQNAKMSLQFDGAPWEPTYNGETLSDTVLGSTWPGQVGQAGTQAILVGFNSEPFATRYGDAAPHGPAPASVIPPYLAAVDRLFPGASGAFNGVAYLDYWVADPWAKGSYSFYKTGQITRFKGIEPVPQGNVFFAGEHTSMRHSDTMNGAVESGMRVAREVIEDVRRA